MGGIGPLRTVGKTLSSRKGLGGFLARYKFSDLLYIDASTRNCVICPCTVLLPAWRKKGWKSPEKNQQDQPPVGGNILDQILHLFTHHGIALKLVEIGDECRTHYGFIFS